MFEDLNNDIADFESAEVEAKYEQYLYEEQFI